MPDTTTPAPATETTAPQRGQRNTHKGGDRRSSRPELAEEKQFDERVMHIDRVARVVKGGRRFRFRALVAVGDRKNRVGIGIAKGADVTAAVTKATEVAKKHFVTVTVTKNGSVPHEYEAKVGGARILIKPASPGTGLIAGGVVRTILEVAGVKNILSKSLGSTNKANTAYATIEALRSVVPESKWVTAPLLKAARKQAATAKSARQATPAKTETKAVPAEKQTAEEKVSAKKPAPKSSAKPVTKAAKKGAK